MTRVYQLSPWQRKSEERGSQLWPLRSLQQDVDNIFENFFRGFNYLPNNAELSKQVAAFSPSLNIAETDKSYNLSVELPGVEEKDIDVSISNGVLTIKGEKKFEEETKEKNYHRVERSYGSFQRTLTLPAEVNEDKIKATFKNGVLEVEIPKVEAKQPPIKKIDVKSS